MHYNSPSRDIQSWIFWLRNDQDTILILRIIESSSGLYQNRITMNLSYVFLEQIMRLHVRLHR